MPKYQKAKPFDFVRDFKDLQTSVKALQIRASGPSAQPNQLVTLASGFTGYATLSDTDTTTYTNANNATQPMTFEWIIPANDASVSTSYEVWVPMSGQTATGTTETLGLKPYLDAVVVTTSNGDIIGATAIAANTAFTMKVLCTLVVTTTGAGGTAEIYIDGKYALTSNVQGSGSTNSLSSQATSVAFDTTVAHTLAIASVWGAASSGQTIGSLANTFTRKGP
jgi:hypothetical protein